MKLRYPLAFAAMFMFSGFSYAENADIESKINSCNQAIAEGDASKALAYAEQVLNQDKNNRGALLCKGRAHGGTGQVKEALAALQAAEKSSATPLDHIVTLLLIGNVQKSAKQYPEALSAYRQSLVIAQTEKDKGFERINLNQIGETLIDTNQQQAGLESYLKGSQLAANDNERADSYARIADTYRALGKYDQAIEYQIKVVVMEQQGGDLNHIANASLELGRIYTAAKDYPNAEKHINKIIQLSKDQSGAFWEAKSYYYLALAKAANNQPEAAKKLLTDAQHICEDIGAESLNDEIGQALNKLPK